MNRETIPALLCAWALACAPPADPIDTPARLVEPEPDRPIQTDTLAFTVARTPDGLGVRIPFTFTNLTGDTVYVVNCRRTLAMSLQKRVADDWVDTWHAEVPQCLSPPVIVPPGGSHADTLHVHGATAADHFPRFERAPEGVHRIVWHALVHRYDENQSGFGQPVPLAHRVSNPFVLR
jgi:hypothetical protein